MSVRDEDGAAQWSTTVTPVVAAITTLCASTALAGVIDGARWLGYAGIAVIVVTATGLGLRAARTPALAVGLAQILALACLVVVLFTNSGVLGVLPGPAALTDLGEVLTKSLEAVRVGIPPVDASVPVLCLVVIAIGLVAVLVDTLAVAAGAPAACGLVLLCVFAVPASLADELLPWWSFVLGATSFAALLAVDGAHRHQRWSNRPALPASGGGFGSPVAMVSSALVLGLVAGVAVTGVGTVGSLPGGGGGGGSGGGLALKPFTALRGMLDQGNTTEVYRVRGLGSETPYLRALTLPTYNSNFGWEAASTLPDDRPARGELPLAPGDDGQGTNVSIEIEPVGVEDLWAPVYGIPRVIEGLPDGMYYDSEGGMVFSLNSRTLPKYTLGADLSQPEAANLRQAGEDYGAIDPIYRDRSNLDAEVLKLADDLTRDKASAFDKVLALKAYFSPDNGFAYRTETGATSDEDALRAFLFDTKVGYCEQYASAMAILARAAGIPSRVAIGYTAGYPQAGDYRSISTTDAHAWVEVYFPNQGWVTFDPTPLTDGRGYQPPYVSADPSSGPSTGVTEEEVPTGPASEGEVPQQERPDPLDPAANAPVPGAVEESWSWQTWTAIALVVAGAVLVALAVPASRGRGRGRRVLPPLAGAVLALAAFFVAASVSWWLAALVAVLVPFAVPAVVRGWRRRERRREVLVSGPHAASAAWSELMAESWDRGADTAETDTVRTAARRLVKEHSLDEPGKVALRTVVDSVERSWYGGRTEHDPALAAAFDELVRGMRRTSPLDWKARLLPRSVVRPRRGSKADPDD